MSHGQNLKSSVFIGYRQTFADFIPGVLLFHVLASRCRSADMIVFQAHVTTFENQTNNELT